jgi:hypothetical protein
MPIPKLPVRAWVQISFVIALFVLSLWIASYLWHAGARTIAGTPLILFAGGMTLYSLWMQFRQHP